MSNVYSTQFMAFAASSGPISYTCPTGYVLIVRDVDLVSGGGAIINYQLQIAGGAKFWAGQFTVESLPQWAGFRGRQVLNAGEVLEYSADGSLDGVVSGYLLPTP